jgi:flagellar biosynthesis/type III secretory pathway M-ring protein FliF/YscJ
MEQLRRALEYIRHHLSGLDTSKKLLIASLAVIMLMTLFVVSQYAGRPRFVPLMPGMSTEDQAPAVALLRTGNRDFQIAPGGDILVRAADRDEIIAQLGESGQMPADTVILFNNLIESQSWTNSRTQNEQLYLLALQNELSRRISDWSVIHAATVVIDAPEPRGVGAGVRRPTAAVTATSANGSTLGQDTVDAIARYVAGAKAGLTPDNVEVVDGATGRARKVRQDDDIDASSYLEAARAVEKLFKDRIYALVSDIPGVVVEVTAGVDVTRRTRTEERVLPKGEGTESLVRRESSKSFESQGATSGAEPGIRSNTGADIRRAGAGATGAVESTDEIEFDSFPGRTQEQIVDPRGNPTRLVATINVPRDHVIALMPGSSDDADGAGPTEEEIDQFWALERERIRERVDPHLQATGPDGEVVQGSVVVALVSSPIGPAPAGAGMPTLGGGGSMSLLGLSGGLVDKVVLVALAGVALAMMLMMVRRSSKRMKLPSAEELVGIPPTLGAGDDIVGEADVSDSPLAGIEIGEDQLRSQKVLEQVAKLIGENPELAGGMLGRWVAAEE